MPSRTRIRCALALLVVLVLVPAGLARANDAYDRVAAAYGQAAGQLDPCTFSTPELESALSGIPREIASYVPAVRQAIERAISAREQGQCRGRRPTGLTTSSATPPPVTTTPPAATPGVATTPGATKPGAATPGTTTPDTEGPQAGVPSEPPVQTAPAPTPPPVQTTQTTTTPGTVVASDGNGKHELLIALIALGAIVLAALLAWAVARWRGWDAGWARRWRHAWGEAAFRTTSTWSEFTDWLRLGR